MSKPFDMALFLSGVLTGSKATQQRSNATYATLELCKRQFNSDGSATTLGLGNSSTCAGF